MISPDLKILSKFTGLYIISCFYNLISGTVPVWVNVSSIVRLEKLSRTGNIYMKTEKFYKY